MTNLTDIRAMDASDPLKDFQDRFDLPENEIYLDGNSLGALPKTSAARLEDVVKREWGRGLIRSWNENDWINMPTRLGAKIARLIGANEDEVVAADSTSINVFKALSACLQLNPDRSVILSERGNFPTDAYMMQGLSAMSGGKIKHKLVETSKLEEALGEDVAVLLLTHTHYKTGQLHDMAAMTKLAQDKGVLVIWDLSHSAGAMPVDLNGCHVDFAVGCGYKYLNGGPGAPAFLFAASRHHDTVFPALSGWMGHAQPFEFDDEYAPADGINRFQCGTPPILGMASLECGLDLMLEADMAQIRAKSRTLGQIFIERVEARCEGFVLASPRDANLRGSQVSIRHDKGYEIMQVLIERGVIGDFRAPDILRFGFTPLYTRYEDIWNAVEILSDIMTSGAWKQDKYAIRSAVT